ncbi:MAG: RNA 2',3'-cyclic phosphodiesterase, partial [Desulfovermiculus sp.]
SCMETRCFVALPLPEAYQRVLPQIASAWNFSLHSRLTWTKQGNWHLTLYFLAEIGPQMLSSVQAALQAVTEPGFTIQAGGAGFFPPGKKPRVVWVGLSQGAEECIRLADKIEKALLPLGFPASSRPFRPHLTVARVKQARPDNWSQFVKWLHNMSWPACQVDRFVLYASRLTPRGPEYSVLQEYFLT